MTVTAIIQRVIRFVLDCICWFLELFYPDKYGYLPPITDPLLLEPATTLVQRIKSGKLKSEKLVQTYIDRIRVVQPYINAITDERFEEALKEAREIDTQIAKQLENGGQLDEPLRSMPFLGIPFTGKDCIAIRGLAFTSGIPVRKHIKADDDAVVVKLHRSAGAIPLCTTNVPELLLWWDTVNKTFGRTNNPYNKVLIPGGSTGGNASLISSAGSLIGIASDIGGSVRIPAYFCGIYGHCCSVGSVPLEGQWPPYTESRKKLISYGPLARYVTDLRPLVKMYMQQETSVLAKLDQVVEVKKMRIFYLTQIDDPSLTPVCDDVKQSLEKVVSVLRSLGALVQPAQLKHLETPFDLWMANMSGDDVNPLAFEMANRQANDQVNLLTELFWCLIGRSEHTFAILVTGIFQELKKFLSKPETKRKLLEKHAQLKEEVHQLLGDDGVLLMPTHPELVVKPISCFLKFKNTCYTGVSNTLQVSMTQIPLGLNKNGLPLGIQAIAGHLNDHLSLSVAEVIDQEFKGWVSPTKIIEPSSE